MPSTVIAAFSDFLRESVNLDPDVTMNQFLEVWKNKVLPAYEKNFQAKCYVVKGIRGECENCFGGMIIWESEAVRDKYWKEDNTFTEMGQAAMDKCQPALDELAKLGEFTSKYTDWVIQ